jgi:hypothetical protein
MKRFHMHVAVADLAANIRFYSQLFGVAPSVEKPDYAKWMLDDPRINFAISMRGAKPGVDHIGLQVESDEELAQLKTRYEAADASAITSETGIGCCYVQSNKHWLTDPQGLAWEAFHSLADIPTFSDGAAVAPANAADAPATSACCAPAPGAAPVAASATASTCCTPAPIAVPPAASATTSTCCAPATVAKPASTLASVPANLATPRGKPVGIAVKAANSCC